MPAHRQPEVEQDRAHAEQAVHEHEAEQRAPAPRARTGSQVERDHRRGGRPRRRAAPARPTSRPACRASPRWWPTGAAGSAGALRHQSPTSTVVRPARGIRLEPRVAHRLGPHLRARAVREAGEHGHRLTSRCRGSRAGSASRGSRVRSSALRAMSHAAVAWFRRLIQSCHARLYAPPPGTAAALERGPRSSSISASASLQALAAPDQPDVVPHDLRGAAPAARRGSRCPRCARAARWSRRHRGVHVARARAAAAGGRPPSPPSRRPRCRRTRWTPRRRCRRAGWRRARRRCPRRPRRGPPGRCGRRGRSRCRPS